MKYAAPFLISILFIFLTGCLKLPTYQEPLNGATVYFPLLKNRDYAIFVGNTCIDWSQSGNGIIRFQTTSPSLYRPALVPVGVPVIFQYRYTSSNQYIQACRASGMTILQEGHEYRFFGFMQKSFDRFFNIQGRRCVIRLFDITKNVRVPLDPVKACTRNDAK